MPDSLEVLAGFNSTRKLKEVIIPANVKTIEESAFNYCEKLKTIIIPATVTKIDDSAFAFCTDLVDVYIPSSVKEMHDYVFLGSDKVVIHTPAGSYAEAFAKRRNISCVNNVLGMWIGDSKVEEEFIRWL